MKAAEKASTKTCYKIMYTRKTDYKKTWYTKVIVNTREQAEKFLDVLEQVSDIYSQLKIETVQIKEGGK